MTRYMIASSLLVLLLAALLYRARRCADLADDCWQPWRDCYPDRLAAELGMAERCRR